MAKNGATKPSEVVGEQSFFDRFATAASTFVSRAPFFVCCVLLVVIWAPTILVMPKSVPRQVDTWQLVINTATTIVTFLMVALIQNAQARFEQATNHKLNAIADALADFMEEWASSEDEACRSTVQAHVHELRSSVGIEERESA